MELRNLHNNAAFVNDLVELVTQLKTAVPADLQMLREKASILVEDAKSHAVFSVWNFNDVRASLIVELESAISEHIHDDVRKKEAIEKLLDYRECITSEVFVPLSDGNYLCVDVTEKVLQDILQDALQRQDADDSCPYDLIAASVQGWIHNFSLKAD